MVGGSVGTTTHSITTMQSWMLLALYVGFMDS